MATLYYESQICHHGILGMKWGIRRYQNKDGTLTKLGQEHVKSKIGQPGVISRSAKKQEIKNELDSSIRDIEQLLKPAHELHSNEKLYEKYLEKAAKVSLDKGIKEGWMPKMDEVEYTKTLNDFIRGYKYDDLNQGDDTAFELYCKDKRIDYQDLRERYGEAYTRYRKAVEHLADDIISSNRDLTINKMKNYNYDEVKHDIAVDLEYVYDYGDLLKRGYWVED